MKFFVYKTLVVVTSIFFLYHLTVGYHIKNLEIKLINYFDKDKIISLRKKIKNEIEVGINKERILSPKDAQIINKFINKLTKELQETK
jgi:hypothetical protein